MKMEAESQGLNHNALGDDKTLQYLPTMSLTALFKRTSAPGSNLSMRLALPRDEITNNHLEHHTGNVTTGRLLTKEEEGNGLIMLVYSNCEFIT